MTQPLACPRCQLPLPIESPGDLCPKCLIEQCLAEESEAADVQFSSERTTTPPGSGAFEPLAPEELTPHFPELEVLELIGRGGMGAVYKARQGKLDRLVALKVLPREIGADPSFAERFTREARALARLGHANIVAVYDFGEADGLFYILMEYVDGANLRQVMARGQMTPEEALKIVPQLCDALQYAHEQGVVHRDIKPENILLDRRGRVKIADFGLSKLIHLDGIDHSLTATHQVMGTLRYMAPEQMLGSKKIDHRADIYSLGIVFYELLTGQVPMGRFDPPSRKVQIDIRLDEVVLRTLEQEPDRRYQQASELKTDVEAVSSSAAAAVLREPRDRSPDEGDGAYDSAANWSSLSSGELQRQCERVARDLRSPAVGLFLAGLAMVLTSLLIVALCGRTLLLIEAAQQRIASPTPASGPVLSGFDSQSVNITFQPHPWAGWRMLLMALLPVQLLSLGAGGLLMASAAHLTQLEHRRLAVVSGVLAMLPLSVAWPLTLPLGGWLLMRLSRPKIRRAFTAVAHELAEMPAELSIFARWGVAATLGVIVGIALLLCPWLPWVEVEFFGTKVLSLGIDNWQGKVALGVAMLALWSCVAIDLSRQSLRWRGLVMLVAALAIGALAGHTLYTLFQPAVQMNSGSGDEMLRPLAEAITQQMASGIKWKPMLGVYVSIVAAALALIYGAVELVRQRTANQASSVESKLRLPAVGLLVSGVLGLAIDLLAFSFLMSEMLRPAPPEYLKYGYLPVMLAIRLPIIGGAICSLFQSNRPLALAGSIAALLPTNIVVLLSLPMGIWSLVVLSQSEVREVFRRNKPPRPESSAADPVDLGLPMGGWARGWLRLPKLVRWTAKFLLAIAMLFCFFGFLGFSGKQEHYGPAGSTQKQVEITVGAIEPWLILKWSPGGHSFVIDYTSVGLAFGVGTLLVAYLLIQAERLETLRKFAEGGQAAIDKERQTGAVWLMLSGAAAAMSWIPVVLASATSTEGSASGTSTTMLWLLPTGYAVLSLVVGLLIVWAGFEMHRARRASFLYAMAIVGILPLTLAWPLTMGFGCQTLLVLSLPGVREQFDRA